jgi:hypothetical protein
MTLILKSNVTYSGPAGLSDIALVSRSAADIYTAYAARVAADGGTIGDAAACLAAITAAITGGYFYKSAIAVSARWGRKVSGSDITKFYNLVDSTKDGTVTGTLGLDTTTLAWNTALWNSADVVTFLNVNVNKTGNMGFVGSTYRINDGAGLNLLFTPAGGQLWGYRDFDTALVGINSVTKLSSAPDYLVPDNCAVGFMVEQASNKFYFWQDGAERKNTTDTFVPLANNTVANVTISRGAIGDTYLNEYWYLNAATYDSVAACSFDVGVRY